MKFFNCFGDSECVLPIHRHDFKSEPRKKPHLADVTDFVSLAVEKGTGLHLLEPNYNVFHELRSANKPFSLQESSEPVVNDVVRHVLRESASFVIRLPGEKLIADREVRDEQPFLLLDREENRNQGYEYIEYFDRLKTWTHGDTSASLSYAEIDDHRNHDDYRKDFIILGKGYSRCCNNREPRIIENMTRFYFHVCERYSTPGDAALQNAINYRVPEHLKPEKLFEGSGRHWNQRHFENLCARVRKAIFDPERGGKDEGDIKLVRHFISKYFRAARFGLRRRLARDHHGYSRQFIRTIAVSLRQNSELPCPQNNSEPETGRKATINEISRKVAVQIHKLKLVPGASGLLEAYQSRKLLETPETDIETWVDNHVKKDTGEISEKIFEALSRAVKATLLANNFKSPPSDNNSAARSDVQGSEDSSSIDWKDLEDDVVCWIIRALTTEVQFRHAAEFLVSEKLPDEKSLAKFICKTSPVKDIPKTLRYFRDEAHPQVDNDDENRNCCDCGDSCCLSSFPRCSCHWFRKISGGINKVFYGKGKRFFCSRGAVLTWSRFGLVLYILLAGLVAISVVIGVKSRDNCWEATEVAMNLILTGAVAIALGLLSFETGGRQVILDALAGKRALKEFPTESHHRREVLQELIKTKLQAGWYVNGENCTWLPHKGSGWTKLPDTVPFQDIAEGGKLFISNGEKGDTIAEICGRKRKIDIREGDPVLTASDDLIQARLKTSRCAYVRVSNMIK